MIRKKLYCESWFNLSFMCKIDVQAQSYPTKQEFQYHEWEFAARCIVHDGLVRLQIVCDVDWYHHRLNIHVIMYWIWQVNLLVWLNRYQDLNVQLINWFKETIAKLSVSFNFSLADMVSNIDLPLPPNPPSTQPSRKVPKWST